MQASFLEIYNEEIRDLLSDDHCKGLELKEGPEGVFVRDLTRIIVKDMEGIMSIMKRGTENRTVGSTNMNAVSSRSHSIFQVHVDMNQPEEGENHFRSGKLSMVDLAGSERQVCPPAGPAASSPPHPRVLLRVRGETSRPTAADPLLPWQSKTGARGERLREGSKINLSLSALGNVISALVDGRGSHIPYRDSKLTRLLQVRAASHATALRKRAAGRGLHCALLVCARTRWEETARL